MTGSKNQVADSLKTPDYSSEKAQQQFLSYNELDQKILEGVHWDWAIIENKKRNIERVLTRPKTIEIAGYTILAMPLETMALTPEQAKKFQEAGGLINPGIKTAKAEENRGKMMYWTESIERNKLRIDGVSYQGKLFSNSDERDEGFQIFQYIYRELPTIQSLTKENAIKEGVYPNIYYRNDAGLEWMANMLGGRLATLDEIQEIYSSTIGKNNVQKLASMGQAPLSGYTVGKSYIETLGHFARLGPGPLSSDEKRSAFRINPHRMDMDIFLYSQNSTVSGVVIFDQ